MSAWDDLEIAISAATGMAGLLVLASDHDRDLLDFAINDIETRITTVRALYDKLHAEVHRPAPMPALHRRRRVAKG